MDYDKADRGTPQEEEIANTTLLAISKIIMTATNAMSLPGGKVTMLAGTAMPSLTGIAMMFAPPAGRSGRLHLDEVMFGALYVINSLELHPDGVIAAFSPAVLLNTVRMFKEITGRDYTNFQESVKQLIADEEATHKVDVPAHLRNMWSDP